MNRIISIRVFIGGLVLTGSFFIIGFILIPGFIKNEAADELTLPEIPPVQNAIEVSASQEIPVFGIYGVCSDIEYCNIEAGIKKIKEAGAEAIIITVVDEEYPESVAYYPSKYLPMAEYVSNDYLELVIELAHENEIKVYASINIPHNYWLARHPDWIAVLSDGQPADTYEKDYFHRIVPPSRIITEEESRGLLKNIIKEVISYGVDGIDINDNFQFSEQYLEKTDTTLYSSFDDFTIRKFQEDTEKVVEGDSPKEKADYIRNQPDVYKRWLSWRAGEVTQLLKILKQDIKDSGSDIPLRPHLLTHEDPYEYYGIDCKKVAKEVDVLYLMIAPDLLKEEHFKAIRSCQDVQEKKIAVSTYLLKEIGSPVIERNEEIILERMKWMIEAGANEIYLYNFELIEKANFWTTLESIINKLKINQG